MFTPPSAGDFLVYSTDVAVGAVDITLGRITLQLGVRVVGTVVDATTSTPLAGINVNAWGDAPNQQFVIGTLTGGDGAFSLLVVRGARIKISATGARPGRSRAAVMFRACKSAGMFVVPASP